MVPVEAANFDRAKVILFVIQKDSYDISMMVTAAYYIGMQYNVVLCIQNIDPDKVQPKVVSYFYPITSGVLISFFITNDVNGYLFLIKFI